MSPDNSKRPISLILSSLLLSTLLFFFLYTSFFPSSRDLRIAYRSSSPPTSQNLTSTRIVQQRCDVFTGNWIDGRRSPYYNNATKCAIDDRQNCVKFGRPDTEFLRWRWKPDDCELPLFDGAQFLEIVKGKSMAFIGDSLARNQMQSLVCLLASTVAEPLDVSCGPDARFRLWLYPEYNFTIAAFWSTHLVRSEDADHKLHSMTSLMNLYLDEADEVWASQIETFDYVIFSAGQWFLRPLMYYKKGKLIGCYYCKEKNVTDFTTNYGHKMAFRTSFRTLLNLKRFNGITFLRTFSPQHYENGEWNTGGNCSRKRPLTKEEVRLNEYTLELYTNQVQELRTAEVKGKKRGLKFRLMDATNMMLVRADGHPNHYGHGPSGNASIADCVHWCLPGPIDTWNEILLQMLKMEA